MLQFQMASPRQVHDLEQEDPAEPVVGHHRHQIVHRGDQGPGGHCGIHMDLFEKQWDQRAHRAGDHHGQQQRDADAAGDGEGGPQALALDHPDEKANGSEGGRPEEKPFANPIRISLTTRPNF